MLVQESQLAFYGDAIVESWRGTQHGADCPKCAEAAAVFDTHFGQQYSSHAWGVAGECSACQQSRLTLITHLAGQETGVTTCTAHSRHICRCCQIWAELAMPHLGCSRRCYGNAVWSLLEQYNGHQAAAFDIHL